MRSELDLQKIVLQEEISVDVVKGTMTVPLKLIRKDSVNYTEFLTMSVDDILFQYGTFPSHIRNSLIKNINQKLEERNVPLLNVDEKKKIHRQINNIRAQLDELHHRLDVMVNYERRMLAKKKITLA